MIYDATIDTYTRQITALEARLAELRADYEHRHDDSHSSRVALLKKKYLTCAYRSSICGKGKTIMEFDYNSAKWKRKKSRILRRDGYACQRCKRYGKNTPATIVHHIKHADEYPELAYVDGNLVSLCAACHNKAHPEKAVGKRRGY